MLFFIKILGFFSNDSPPKSMESIFYLIQRPSFVLKIFKFLYFFSSFPYFWDRKEQVEVEQFSMSWIGFHKFPDVIFAIIQKTFYSRSSNLTRLCITNKATFLNLFRNLKSDWSLVPGFFLLFLITFSFRNQKLNFLRLSDNSNSKYLIFKSISCIQWLF